MYAAIIIILFSPSAHLLPPPNERTDAAAAAVCWLDLPRDLSPPSFRRSFAVIVARPPPTKESNLNFPPKPQFPGHFTSVQETGRSSRSAHWPRNGGGRTERAPPNANAAAAAEEEEKKGEATRSNIRNRRLPDALSTCPTWDLIHHLCITKLGGSVKLSSL